jgi:hypothetical protein
MHQPIKMNKEKTMKHTRQTIGGWILVLLLALLLAACGGGEEAADAPQGEQAAEVDAGETEEEETTGTAVCMVPAVVGFDQANAERMVQGVGLLPVRSAEFSAEVPEGQVIAQEPAGDTRLDPCEGEVSIVVSLGADSADSGAPAAEEETLAVALLWQRSFPSVKLSWASGFKLAACMTVNTKQLSVQPTRRTMTMLFTMMGHSMASARPTA